MNKKWDPKETPRERYRICKKCPELIPLTKTCKRCGCFMYFKTKLKDVVCPEGKW